MQGRMNVQSSVMRATILVSALALSVSAAGAQQAPAPDIPQPVMSMGQPPRWQPYGAALAVGDRTRNGPAASVLLGVHHPIMNPVVGLLGVSGEAYAVGGGGFAGEGIRALATSRLLALGAGLDWNIERRRVDFMLSYQTAILRGGLLGHGSMLRLDWLPTRGRSFAAGITVPLLQPFAGRTRPRHTDAELPDPIDLSGVRRQSLPVAAEAALGDVEHAMAALQVYDNLYLVRDVETLRASPSFADAQRNYERGLARAFGAAVGDSASGARVAARARAALLDDVLIPYDSLFGQVKDEPQVAGLTGNAQQSLERWLRDSSSVAPAARDAALRVNARWLGMVEQVHDRLLDRWDDDSRAVWLPLQLALSLDQYDDQVEVDSLL